MKAPATLSVNDGDVDKDDGDVKKNDISIDSADLDSNGDYWCPPLKKDDPLYE